MAMAKLSRQPAYQRRKARKLKMKVSAARKYRIINQPAKAIIASAWQPPRRWRSHQQLSSIYSWRQCNKRNLKQQKAVAAAGGIIGNVSRHQLVAYKLNISSAAARKLYRLAAI